MHCKSTSEREKTRAFHDAPVVCFNAQEHSYGLLVGGTALKTCVADSGETCQVADVDMRVLCSCLLAILLS